MNMLKATAKNIHFINEVLQPYISDEFELKKKWKNTGLLSHKTEIDEYKPNNNIQSLFFFKEKW